jgi:adenylate cyclase
MFTDIVGYTSLMGDNESKAFELLKKNRQIHKPIIKKHGGKWLKEMGDGVLASFSTVSDAKICESIRDLTLRIGIHQGEVVFEGEDVFGDGVNIASRLESIAPIGGIYVSESVFRNIQNKEGVKADFVKEETLKNVKHPVKIYEVKGKVSESYISKKQKHNGKRNIRLAAVGIVGILIVAYFLLFYQYSKPPKVIDKSIAVLPFTDMSPNKDQEYFSDGMMEEILNHLYKVGDIRIPSKTTLIRYKKSSKTVTEIAEELNVSYILEGSVRKDGENVRITVQLIDPIMDTHLWSETYDKQLKNIFSIQSEVAQQIASYLKAEISPDIIERIESIPTDNLEAYELYLKAQYINNNQDLNDIHWIKSANDSAIQLLQAALALDPEFAEAYLGLGTSLMRKGSYVEFNWEDTVLALINKSLQIKSYLSEAYSSKAYIYQILFNFDAAEENYRLALKYDPNNAFAISHLWSREIFKGNYEKGANYGIKWFKIKLANPQEQEHTKNLYYFYIRYGDSLKAMNILKKKLEADSNDSFANYHLRTVASMQGKRNEVLEYAKKVESDPLRLGLWYSVAGDYMKAEEIYKTGIKEMPDDKTKYFGIYFLHRYGFALIQNNKKEEGNKVLLQELQKLLDAVEKGSEVNRWGGKYYDIACIYSSQGNLDGAVKYLLLARENQFRGSFFFMDVLLSDPMLDNVRDDERFKKLISEEFQNYILRENIFRRKVDSIRNVSELAWLKDK